MNAKNNTGRYDQKTILIIEDDLILTLSLELMLKKAGFIQFIRAEDAQTAVKKAEEQNVDLIIADIYLGEGLSGIEAVKKIQAKQTIPVIYITGNSDEKHKELAGQTDFAAYLVKPISYNSLNNTISHIWSQEA